MLFNEEDQPTNQKPSQAPRFWEIVEIEASYRGSSPEIEAYLEKVEERAMMIRKIGEGFLAPKMVPHKVRALLAEKFPKLRFVVGQSKLRPKIITIRRVQ